MKRFLFCIPVAFAAVMIAWPPRVRADDPVSVDEQTWTMKAEVVEATSDQGLCPSHDIAMAESAKHRCKFICAMKVQEGGWRRVNLAGIKFVVAGDLGRSLEGMELSALSVTWDPSMSVEQKIAMADVLQKLFPQKWVKRSEGVAAISWDSHDDVLDVRIADRGQVNFTEEKDAKGMPVVRSGTGWWNATRTGDLRMGHATFGYKADGMDLNFAKVGAFRTSIEAKGSLEKVPSPLPAEPAIDPTMGKK